VNIQPREWSAEGVDIFTRAAKGNNSEIITGVYRRQVTVILEMTKWNKFETPK